MNMLMVFTCSETALLYRGDPLWSTIYELIIIMYMDTGV